MIWLHQYENTEGLVIISIVKQLHFGQHIREIMATLRRWRLEKTWRRDHSAVQPIDIDNDYNYKINRYQKANWGDVEAKEAHASVVKYLWRKERELNKKKEALKNQISSVNSETSTRELNNVEVTSTKSESRGFTKREIEAPTRGIHFRTIEDKTMDKLNLMKSERKILDNMSYIEKVRSKENNDIEDDISDDLKNLIRGKTAHRISAALLDDSDRKLRLARRQELAKFGKEQPTRRGIYEIMVDRNKLGVDENERYRVMRELKTHRDHDYRWTNGGDYLNLVGYRMQNDIADGCFMQNHGEIVWGPLKHTCQ